MAQEQRRPSIVQYREKEHSERIVVPSYDTRGVRLRDAVSRHLERGGVVAFEATKNMDGSWSFSSKRHVPKD